MSYCLNTDVYRIAGISSDEITSANVDSFILSAMAEVDRYTGTVWLYTDNTDHKGDVASATDNTLTKTSAGWTADEFNEDYSVYVVSGTGSGQIRDIIDNDTDTITVGTDWDTNPDSTSTFEIFYAPKQTETVTGSGTDVIFTRRHPVFSFVSGTVDSTSVASTDVYNHSLSGELTLKSTADVAVWSDTYPQQVVLNYYYGVRPDSRLKPLIRDFTAAVAAMMTLTAQIGGTFDDVTSYGIPGGFTASKGEPYTNIREALVRTKNHMEALKQLIPRYIHVG